MSKSDSHTPALVWSHGDPIFDLFRCKSYWQDRDEIVFRAATVVRNLEHVDSEANQMHKLTTRDSISTVRMMLGDSRKCSEPGFSFFRDDRSNVWHTLTDVVRMNFSLDVDVVAPALEPATLATDFETRGTLNGTYGFLERRIVLHDLLSAQSVSLCELHNRKYGLVFEAVELKRDLGVFAMTGDQFTRAIWTLDTPSYLHCTYLNQPRPGGPTSVTIPVRVMFF